MQQFGIRIFQVPDRIGDSASEWLDWVEGLSEKPVDSVTIAGLWDDAFTLWNSGVGGEIGQWFCSNTCNAAAIFSETLEYGVNIPELEEFYKEWGEWFWWDGVGGLSNSLRAPIPEPSTYAALFGILALGFAAYRRRK